MYYHRTPRHAPSHDEALRVLAAVLSAFVFLLFCANSLPAREVALVNDVLVTTTTLPGVHDCQTQMLGTRAAELCDAVIDTDS